VVAGVDLPHARSRRLQQLPRAYDDDDRRQIPVAEAGDEMRDYRWRLGRRHAGTRGEAGDRGRVRSRSSPVGATALMLGCRDEVPTCAAVAGGPTRQHSSSPERGQRGERSLKSSLGMEGSTLTGVGLGDEGRRDGRE
jgi:hypothetical protein